MNKIDGKLLGKLLHSGVNALSNNTERIDALNVFPVPDGDTGSNMGATALAAYSEIADMKSSDISEISAKFARGMLLGARGNSGVILSQIFKGISIAFEGKKEATVANLVEAFKQAKEYGYKSVMKPIEGTILTVIKMTANNLSKTIKATNSVEDFFESATKFAREACDKTPDLLPVLKEVGVTDSGGEGLFLIIEGMHLALKGKAVKKEKQAAVSKSGALVENETFDGEFGYCTEFIVELKTPKHFKKTKFQQGLEKLNCSSIVVVQDKEILKVHIHTETPGKILTYAQKFGEFIKIKSENMTLQANESKGKATGSKNAKKAEEVNIGIIACNVGNGIISDMKEFGVDFVIEGGQTMNPSAKDFIDAIGQINSDKIIILPNNSNVILAAQQVAQTIKDKEVLIIPTKTQMQGLAAIMNFNRDGTLKENKAEMTEAIGMVKTGQVTFASRTTKIEGVQVKKGQYLAIAERKILKSTTSKVKSAIEISKKLIDDETELVTIYFGNEATSTDAEEIASFIETHYDVEVEVKDGGQPVYHFLMAYE